MKENRVSNLIRATCIFKIAIFVFSLIKSITINIMYLTLNSIIFEPIRRLSIILKFSTFINKDEELAELSSEYNSKYLIEGWSIITGLIKAAAITIFIFMFLFLSGDDPSFMRAKIVCPTILVNSKIQ